MPQRIVVSLRGVVPAGDGGGAKYLERALALKKRAGALGGTLCAWSASTFSCDFGSDELEEALSLAMLVSEGEVAERTPAGERFGAGVAQGEMSTVGEGGSLAMLSWGMPLVTAVALARDARAGEALIDPALLAERGGELDEVGFGVHAGDGPARLVRTREPPPPPPPRVSLPPPSMRFSPSSASLPAVSGPPSVPRGPQSALISAGSQPSTASQSGPQSSRPVRRAVPPPPGDAAIAPIAPIVPIAPIAPIAPVAPPLEEELLEPATVRAPILSSVPPSAPMLSSVPPRGPSVPPRDSGGELAELAKRALVQGDVSGLERLIEELRDTGERSDLVERMSGMVALQRGATAEALRRLRAAAEAVREPAQCARARLAYGVALATAGRTDGALLEGLEALARAREADDAHGEHACALFLARLSAGTGHQDAAGAWAFVAARKRAGDPASRDGDPSRR